MMAGVQPAVVGMAKGVERSDVDHLRLLAALAAFLLPTRVIDPPPE
jgi:hypothetical protein